MSDDWPRILMWNIVDAMQRKCIGSRDTPNCDEMTLNRHGRCRECDLEWLHDPTREAST